MTTKVNLKQQIRWTSDDLQEWVVNLFLSQSEKSKLNNIPPDINSALALKVDKVTWKGLSTEDYSTAEKNKLAWIEIGAEVNEVNEAPIDWNQYVRKNWDWTIWSWAVDSVNWETWVVTLDTDDISEGTTNKYVTSAEKTAITHSNRTALDNVSNTNSWDNATNSQYSWLATSKANSLTPTAIKTANYTANANEYVPIDITAWNVAITLPNAPDNGTTVQVCVIEIWVNVYNGEIVTQWTDKIWSATWPAWMFLSYDLETATLVYNNWIWANEVNAIPYNFASAFVWIDQLTPITNANISINTTTRVLTITPPNWLLRFYIDWNGRIKRFRKSWATINFPAFTDTSWMWYFYFDNTWTAVTTQTAWTSNNFCCFVPVYRMLRNKDLFKFTVTSATATLWDTYTNNSSTFTVTQTISWGTTLICQRTSWTNDPASSWNLTRATGAGTNPIVFSAWDTSVKDVSEYIEYHLNTIPAEDHEWKHLQGAIYETWFSNINNVLATWTPNADWRNAVISLTTGTNMDDNLDYTVTNNTSWSPWTQDMWNITAWTLNATNSGLFKIYTQNARWLVNFLPATRFPFAWDVATNRPQTISSTWVRTLVPDNRWFVYFIYATQNPRVGEAIKLVSATSEFSSLANAQAYNWVDIQNTYTSFANDLEIRPMYRVIFYNDNSWGWSFDAWTKFTALREVQDIRKTIVSSSTTIGWSLPASSVIFTPVWNVSSTNVQSAIEELDTEKLANSMTTARLLWRNTVWTWIVEEITLWTWLTFSWTTLNASWGWRLFDMVAKAGTQVTWTIATMIASWTWTIAWVKISLWTLPTWANFIVDVRKNWTATTNSIFTSDAWITIATNTSATNGMYTVTSTTIDNWSFVENDVLYVIVSQIGSTLTWTDFTCVMY